MIMIEEVLSMPEIVAIIVMCIIFGYLLARIAHKK